MIATGRDQFFGRMSSTLPEIVFAVATFILLVACVGLNPPSDWVLQSAFS